MKTSSETLGIALDALDKGYAPIPCDGKVPLVKWKEFQTKLPTAGQVREWFSGGRINIAILCTGMVVFDCDRPELAELVLEKCGDTPHRIRTPSGGIHLGYRLRAGGSIGNKVRILRSGENPDGVPIDIRSNGGIEVIPNSATEKGEYRWFDGCGLRPASELPCGNIGWTRQRRRKPRPARIGELRPVEGRVRNPERYCLTIPSIQGRNGSKGLVRVVCILREARRTPEQAFDYVFHVWNRACAEPMWSEADVRHCIGRHYGLR